jgi:toxin ParE1/3/4
LKSRKVLLETDAKSDLKSIHRWIVDQGSPKVASAYLRRIQSFIRGLVLASERGLARDDVAPGLRMIPFESVIVAVLIQENIVVVLRVFHGSQDWQSAIEGERSDDA